MLSMVEQLSADLREAQVEIKRLRDDITQLKSKPKLKANTPRLRIENYKILPTINRAVYITAFKRLLYTVVL